MSQESYLEISPVLAASGEDKLAELRERHPCLRYKSYTLKKKKGESGETLLELRNFYLLEPGVELSSFLEFEVEPELELSSLEAFAFNIGLVEAISFWKAACPQRFIVEAGRLDEGQKAWWHHLFLHGLGEFFYLNKIDFSAENFLEISNSDSAPEVARPAAKETSGSVVLVAGGKDSVVSLNLLRQRSPRPLFLNPTKAALDSVTQVVATPDVVLGAPMYLQRKIDPTLLALNKAGYLNGHTPFSAFLAFSCSMAAYVSGERYVIASNELSASEENATHYGMKVNHQYSKSFEFESAFRSYAEKYLSKDVEYFSYLRPLYELQIAKLFSCFPEHFETFRSCNVGQRDNSWCGHCPKCAFVYLLLAVFLSGEEIALIFGEELLERQSIQEHIEALTGFTDAKPFECVGTEGESSYALMNLILDRFSGKTQAFILGLRERIEERGYDEKDNWFFKLSKPHFLPVEFEETLMNAMAHTAGGRGV